jgi:hypothetical protein
MTIDKDGPKYSVIAAARKVERESREKYRKVLEREYLEEHRDERKAYWCAYYEKNRDSILLKQRARRRALYAENRAVAAE